MRPTPAPARDRQAPARRQPARNINELRLRRRIYAVLAEFPEVTFEHLRMEILDHGRYSEPEGYFSYLKILEAQGFVLLDKLPATKRRRVPIEVVRRLPTTGVCFVCGCTNQDCRWCFHRTGLPCSWVKPDLCSACEPEGLIGDRP